MHLRSASGRTQAFRIDLGGTWTGSLGSPATVVNGRVYCACDNQVVVLGVVPVPPKMSVKVDLFV